MLRGRIGGSLVIGIVLFGCAPPDADPPPNVVLYIVDTLRADRLGCYGHTTIDTPAVDLFAQQGTLFEAAYAPSSWTRASLGTMLSATDPVVHGAEGRDGRLAERAHLLSEMLSEHGYRSCMITANPNVGSFFGFDQGFDEFVEMYERADAGFVNAAELIATGPEVVDEAIAWLETAPEPFLLVLLVIDPHAPYAPPAEFDRYDPDYEGPVTGGREWINREELTPRQQRRIRALYEGEVAYADHAFGRLLEQLDERDLRGRTITVYTSDHGEELWEHGDRGHGKTLFDEVLHVPLIVRYPPSVAAGARVAREVSTIDLVPTILELARLPIPATLDRSSLLAERTEPSQLYASLNHDGHRLVSMRRDHEQLIFDEKNESWVLLRRGRPVETFDERTRQLVGALRQRVDESRRIALVSAGEPDPVGEPLPERTRELLETLGYLDDVTDDATD